MDHLKKALMESSLVKETGLKDSKLTDEEYKNEMERLQEEAEEKARAARNQQRINNLVKYSGLSGRFRNRNFGSFKTSSKTKKAFDEMKWYADNFSKMQPKVVVVDKGKESYGFKGMQKYGARVETTPPEIECNGILATGGYGTGKTHLASAIANQLLDEGTPVICMTMIALLDKIKQTFGNDPTATEESVLKLFSEVELLIIDDLGSETPTEWSIGQIFKIINARYEAYMPVVITTNYKPSELIKRLTPKGGDPRNAEKTVDRLREVCVGVQMDWESWRGR